MQRRKFISNLALGSAISASFPLYGPNYQPQTKSKAKIKSSCNIYSFNQLLTDGTMTLPEAFDLCAEIGFDAVDPTGYYFPGYPDVPSDAYIYEIKRHAFVNGLDISGTGIRNDFALPDRKARQENVELTKRWVEVSAKLDAPALRVFAGAKMPEGVPPSEVHKWIVDCLWQCVDFARDHGVMIVLQNHFDALRSVAEVRSVLDQVQDPWFGLELDIGSQRLTDPYEEVRALAPYARTWQIKEFVYRNDQQERTDVKKLVDIFMEVGYRGYIPIETLPPSDPRERLKPFLEEIQQEIASRG